MDLSTFLMTLAGISAGVIAIFGGLSFSSDRVSLIEHKKQTDRQIDERRSEIAELEEESYAYYALHFISDNVDHFVGGEDLRALYVQLEKPLYPLGSVGRYLDRAMEIYGEEFTGIAAEMKNLKDGDVPSVLKKGGGNFDFDYEVRHIIYLELRNRRRGVYDTRFKEKTESYVVSGLENNLAMDQRIAEIKKLESDRYRTDEKISSLSNPKVMKSEVIILALFALTCVVAPIIVAIFDGIDDGGTVTLVVKAVFVLLFVAGLASVFGYLLKLFVWDERHKGDGSEEGGGDS